MLVIMLSVALFPSFTYAQRVYNVNKEESEIEIQGTSSIHDWEMIVEDYQLETQLAKGENNAHLINMISFSCAVEAITADNRIMDGKTHDALKEDDHPRIQFTANYNDSPLEVVSGKTYIKGSLRIAGVTRKIQFPVNIRFISGSSYRAKGEVSMRMTDFNVEPPTAMMGALETGDEVTIVFNFVMQQ
jgi:hypothetical protein